MPSGRDDHGFKRSSGVDYSLVQDRQIDDHRFERQRAIRAASAAPPVEKPTQNAGAKAGAPQSATMDAFMRMVTGKEERTIADRISDPNRPTWEQFKKENADKLDLSGDGEREMKEYRKKLDAARDRKLAGGSSKKRKKKHKKRSRSSSSDDSSSDDERRRSRHKSRRKKKSHKRRRGSSDSDDSDSDLDSEDDRSRRRRRSKKSKKSSRRKDRSASPSPVKLSSFLQQSSDNSDNESS